MRRPLAQGFSPRQMRRALTGVAVAAVAILAVSCGAAERPDVVLLDFDDPGAAAGWTTVNDPVMGGVSTSSVTVGDGGLVFSGTVSLQNNGGFASARGPQDPGLGARAAGATSLRVHARGDGKTYLVKVGIDGQPWSYIQRFRTEAGIPRVYELPIAGFEPVGMRLTPAPDAPRALDPALIDEVALYILDKQQGPFEITVSSIDAVA